MTGFGWRTAARRLTLVLWESLFGAKRERTAIALCAGALLLIGFLVGRIVEGGDADSLRNAERRATNLLGVLEAENTILRQGLESERLRRNLSEKSLRALREQMETVGADLVRNEKEISFLKQLLQERTQIDSEVAIRSFDISPDFREDSYTLEAVLIRDVGAARENFTGSFDLAINIDSGGAAAVVYYPEGRAERAEIDFRFYHEIAAPFRLPAGSSILNARFSVYDSTGEIIASKILVEESLLDPEPDGATEAGAGLN